MVLTEREKGRERGDRAEGEEKVAALVGCLASGSRSG